MDGTGTWRYNVVARMWRTIKYERRYLRAYDGVSEALPHKRSSIGSLPSPRMCRLLHLVATRTVVTRRVGHLFVFPHLRDSQALGATAQSLFTLM